MIKSGHIRLIEGKVKFEYFELPHPDDNYASLVIPNAKVKASHKKAMKAYEASKRLVEVSNVKRRKSGFGGDAYFLYNSKELTDTLLINNQPCKAEVNGKATIIELD